MKWLGGNSPLVSAQLAGKTLTIRRGTIPEKADKDDAWWAALSNRYDKIFDIGANVGYATLLATINDTDKTVVLADPNPKALEIAKENLESNGLGGNKTYINTFVGNENGKQVKFYTLGTGSAGSMYGSHADSAKAVNAYTMVNTTTLDDIVTDTGIIPELVKIDVEAAESYVLQGATKLAAKQSAIFMVEMHGPEEMPMIKNAGLVLDWCTINSYTAWYMKEHTQLMNAEQISHRGRCHLLLLPQGIAYPDYLKEIEEGESL